MDQKKKAAGVVSAPSTAQSKTSTGNFPTIQRRAKALIVVATLRGWLPYPVAQWLIQHGGLLHA